MEQLRPDDYVTVVLPEFLPARWWQHLLHNQTCVAHQGRAAVSSQYRGRQRAFPFEVDPQVDTTHSQSQPDRLKPRYTPDAQRGGQRQDDWIAVSPLELWHELEVHSIKTRDHRRHGNNGGPCRQPTCIFLLRNGRQRQIRFEGRGDQLADVVDHLVDPDDVIMHIPVIRLGVLGNEVEVVAHQPATHFHERRYRSLQGKQIALERIDPLGRSTGHADVEDLVLQVLQPRFVGFDDRQIRIDDEVHQRVKHKPRPLLKLLRHRLAAGPKFGMGSHGPMANGDQIVRADKNMRFAELEDAIRADLHGAEHDEEGIAVLLQFGALMRPKCVLYRQIMQAELLLNLPEDRLTWFVQPNPDKPPALGQRLADVGEGEVRYTAAVRVRRAVHDARFGGHDRRFEGHTAPDRDNTPADALEEPLHLYISTWTPSSTTRSGGRRKNAVARTALRVISTNSRSRHIAMPGRSVTTTVSRPRK